MSELRNKMIQQMQLKGYSKNTIAIYIECLVSHSKQFKTSPDLLSVDQIREYIHYKLTEAKLSKSWMNQTIRALKILFCEVLKRDWDGIDIPRPRREIKLPVVLSKEEVSRIINTPRNLKHKAFLMLTYSAGLRLQEACNLKIRHIDSQRIHLVQVCSFDPVRLCTCAFHNNLLHCCINNPQPSQLCLLLPDCYVCNLNCYAISVYHP